MDRNRLKFWRQKRGLSGQQLAKLVGMSQPNYYRIETGEVKLTVDIMRKLALALDVSPVDLLPLALVADANNHELDPTPLSTNDVANAVMVAKGLTAYRVLTSKVSRAGVHDGDVIVADGSQAALSALTTGKLVVISVELPDQQPRIALRQFIEPSLVVTNWERRNTVLDLNDDAIPARVIGVIQQN